MPLSPTRMDSRTDAHFGFEARDERRGVLATLTAEVEHDIGSGPTGATHGRDRTRGFYDALFGDLSDGACEPLRRLDGPDCRVDDSRWHGRAPGRRPGFDEVAEVTLAPVEAAKR